MQLKTDQIRDFQRRTSFMQPNNLLPVLSYIKLHAGALIKTNMAAWALMPIDAPADITLLLDEKMLYNFISHIEDEEFSLEIQGNKITLIASNLKTHFQTTDAVNYPVMPVDNLDIEPQVITDTSPYRMAAAYALRNESIPTFKSYVHSVNNLIWAGDGSAFFSYKQMGPNLTISLDAVKAIVQFDSVQWRRAGNYDFFMAPGITYGFICSELKGPDISRHLPDKAPSASTEVSRAWLLSFCEMCISSTPKAWAEVKLHTTGTELTLMMLDNDYNSGNNTKVPCNIVMPDFNFNAAILANMLKPLPYETLTIYRDQVQLTIRSIDENFQAMLQGLVSVL